MGQRMVAANGIELQVTEEGDGALVVLCHGFPELAYSWRFQLPVLAEAGYRAVAPDMRGYGGSSRPDDPEAYDILTLCDDMAGLLDALGADDAVFVGHDWGANVVWQLARSHPNRVRAVAGLSVPFVPRPTAPPVERMRERFGDDFYIVWFQEPGVAEAALEKDVRRTLTTGSVWTSDWAADETERPQRPRWWSEEDLAVYVDAFERTGFSGGLNYYRNLDRNWRLTEHLADVRVDQPALFVTGERDPVRLFMPAERMDGWVTDLRESVILDGAGHWIQQERPDEVNRAMLDFLRDVAPVA